MNTTSGFSASISDLVAKISDAILNPLLALLFAVCFFMFMYGVTMYLYQVNMHGKWEGDGKQHMLWGIIGMFIMVAAWAIIKMIDATLGANVVY